MREITINGVTYQIKFSYRAAKYKKCVEEVFALLSGAVLMGDATDTAEPKFSDLIKGSCKQVAMIPSLCDTMFFAGLIEDKNESKPKTEEEAGDLLISYMEENEKTYNDIYNSLMECMGEDGFFEKAGITQMLESMFNKENEENPAPKKVIPMEKKTTKKKTSTK